MSSNKVIEKEEEEEEVEMSGAGEEIEEETAIGGVHEEAEEETTTTTITPTPTPTPAATTTATARGAVDVEVEDIRQLAKLITHYARTLGVEQHAAGELTAKVTLRVGGGLIELVDLDPSRIVLTHLRVPAHTRGEAGPSTVAVYLSRLEAAPGAGRVRGTLTLDGEKLTYTPATQHGGDGGIEIGYVANNQYAVTAFDHYLNFKIPEPECHATITARQAQTLARAVRTAKDTVGYTILKLHGDKMSIHGEGGAEYAEITPPARRVGGEGAAQAYPAKPIWIALNTPGAASYTISWGHSKPAEIAAHIPYGGRGAQLRVITAPRNMEEE